MDWRHSGSTYPKISECKNALENFWPQFFGVKMASFSFIIFQRTKLSTQSITHLCWCNWRTFWRIIPAGISSRCLVLARISPANWALTTQKELDNLGFQCLQCQPYSPDLVRSDYHLFLGLKKQLKFRNFSSDSNVIGAAKTWLDGQISNFFNVLQKLEQRAKKCIELRVKYAE